ncbi:MAG: beta-ketoacyl synthase N-terminal-like domain-containing protein [Xenococcaceae cyanobacterium MO_188.B19]|nr:beta-ketoacyl synthase N-terminal-like domain-containing protein [Xenococcaceae cyanobacterium MO_188.B19]
MQLEPIAIAGIGCRFPGANNPQEFWDLLCQGKDGITEIPESRWDRSKYYHPDGQEQGKTNICRGGFLENITAFDPQFFGIAPREAKTMDPQQRLLLEVAWEALEDGGAIPEELRGTNTGVYIGIGTHDYSILMWQNPVGEPYATTGTGNCIAANRISYAFDFKGASLAVDTACSSSLVAVHLACQSIWNGESDMALAGGVNVLLLPHVLVGFAKGGFLSPDGKCKSFDADANGYVRSEGAGIVFLKPLSKAEADGDRIYGIIRGCAINQDGCSNGIAAPNPDAQEAVIKEAYQRAGVDPNQVQYIEAHGTGTKLGDPIEIESLGRVLSKNRTAENYCAIGSVKTNIGHTETAAGVAGLIKAALSLHYGKIPPSLHFNKPNPAIDFDSLAFKVNTELTSFRDNFDGIFVGVNSFGFGGTNAHVVLEGRGEWHSPNKAIRPKGLALCGAVSFRTRLELPLRESQFNLFTISAKNQCALKDLTREYIDYLDSNKNINLADICFTANAKRTHFNHRIAITIKSKEELKTNLINFINDKDCNIITGEVKDTNNKIAFLFTGQGSQYLNMGKELYETKTIFRDNLNRCAAILETYLDTPLLDVIYSNSNLINRTKYTQPVIFSVGYSLAQLWIAWGIKPDVLCGHSIGEYIAATIAGVFSLEDALKLVSARGKLMQSLPQNGSMISVLATETQVTEVIQDYSKDVSIAAINGHNSIVISGATASINKIVDVLNKNSIKTKQLTVSHAFHSPLMQPMISAFEQAVSQVSFSPPQIDLISNVTGKLATREIATPEYWCRHVLEPVKFTASMETLIEQDCELLIECGSKPILLAMGRQCLPEVEAVWLPSLRQGKSDWEQMLESLGSLSVQGVPINWSGFEKCYHRRRLQLPTYPFQRERYWSSLAQVKIADPSPMQTVTNLPLDRDVNQQKLTTSQLKSNTGDREIVTQETITVKIKHLISEIAKIRPQKLCVQNTFHELGFDSLMLMEMRTKLSQSFSITQNFPLKMFFGGATVEELINFICENVREVTSTENNSSQSRLNLSPALVQFQHWQQEFQPHKLIRIEKHLVHKSREQNVLISKLKQLEPDSIAGEIVQDVYHPFFYEHPKDHVPGLYIIEAVRQFGTVLSHLYYKVPLSMPFILDDMQTQFYKFAETDRPLFAWAKIQDKAYTKDFVSHMQIVTSIVQDEKVIASVSGLFRIFESFKYNNLRQESLQSLKAG